MSYHIGDGSHRDRLAWSISHGHGDNMAQRYPAPASFSVGHNGNGIGKLDETAWAKLAASVKREMPVSESGEQLLMFND